MTSFGCSRLSSGAAAFVPRRLATSPFDPSTSNYKQDSDCGSSSGLGGMKTQELISDEGGSSSDEPQPVYPRPSTLGSPLPCIPPMPMNGGPPSWMHPMPPGSNNDLFVHVQVGEVLSIMVGNDLQHITGPATVRMVGESGMAPMALPIQVPPGHMVHQIVDEQGVLRHLILSPEVPARYPTSVGTPSSGIGTRLPTPLLPYSALYTVQRKYPYNHKNDVITPSTVSVEPEEEDLDSDEISRIKEMLSRMQPPTVLSVYQDSADISWQAIDTSEAAANGGQFPQIDASEFTYHIVLYERDIPLSSYQCNPSNNPNNFLRLGNLRPNTNYYVQLRVALEERSLGGEFSNPVLFKTPPGPPEAPTMPRILMRGLDYVSICWRCPENNGASIVNYVVYLSKDAENYYEKVWEGRNCDTRILNLKPCTSYRIQVAAVNHVGEGATSQPLNVITRSDTPPPQPAPPSAVAQPRGVRLSWNSNPELLYTAEMWDVSAGPSAINTVKEKGPTCSTYVADLIPGCEYRFRIQSHSMDLDSRWSEWTVVKLAKIPEKPNPLDRVLIPQKPSLVAVTKRKLEIHWKTPGAKEREFTFHLEGSTYGHPGKFLTLYKGINSVYLLTEDDLQNFRVQTISKKNNVSDFSEVLTVARAELESIDRPPQMAVPLLEPAGRGCLRAKWEPPYKIIMPSSAHLEFEVRRIDGRSETVYRGPDEETRIEGLANRQHIEVQVRAVIVSSEGARHDGDWSSVASGTAPRDPPRPPKDLWLAQDLSAIHWNAPDTSSDLRYRVECREEKDGQTVDERAFETGECRHQLSHLTHARQYSCRVFAFHDGGESQPSESVQIATPAGVPAQPENVTIETESTSVLVLRWTAPDCRGEAIQSYKIRIEAKGELLRENTLSVPSSPAELRLPDLEPDTQYRVEVSAKNSVGSGISAAVFGRTRALPPKPPRIDADCEATVLRLRWKALPTHSLLTYKVVRLDEDDNPVPVYEGDQNKYKMRGLAENSLCRLRIRASDRVTGVGDWSEVFTFKTLLTPPPVVKSPPTATASGTGFYQLEWSPAIGRPNPRRLFYRVQAIDCSLDHAKWQTVYEGALPSFTFRVADYPSAVQARVHCVRPEAEEEVVGPPSPVVYIAKQAPERKEQEPPVVMAKPRHDFGRSLLNLRADFGSAAVTIVVFLLLAWMMAFVCYHWIGPQFEMTTKKV